MAVYTNDLRLKEIANGDESGTWGTSTNLNLKLIGEALSFQTEQVFSSDGDATTTVADGSEDPARGLFYKATSSGNLTATRVLTIAPATISRVMFIENATSGSQSITVRQSSGGTNVTIPNGQTKAVYLDGADTNPNVVDAFQDLSIPDLFIDDDLTVGDDLAVSGLATIGETLGVTGVLTANAGVVVDNITIDGTEIDLSSGDLTIDVAGDIILDADGADITLKDGGTTFGTLQNNSGDFRIASNVSDKDIVFLGDDGGSTITSLTLDMSAAGKAIFNAGIVVNESGGDNNTRFEGDSVTSLFEIDASTDRIGIGTSAPSEQLTIQNANDAVVLIESSGSDATDDARLEIKTTNGTFTIQNDRSLGTSGALTFAGNTSNNIVIDHNAGDIGIGTSTLNKFLNLADPNEGGETLKLHFEASSSADKWAIFSFDRTNSHYAGLSFGANSLVIEGGGNIIVNENSADADFRIESDSNTHAFFVNGEFKSVIGMATSSPVSYANGDTVLYLHGAHNPAIALSDNGQTRDYFITAQGSALNINYADGSNSSSASNVSTLATFDNGGNVGIGPNGSSPNQYLSIIDTSGSNDVAIEFTADYSFVMGADTSDQGNFKISRLTTTLGTNDAFTVKRATGNVVINEGGADSDFRAESDNNANMFGVNAGSDFVYIGADEQVQNGTLSINAVSSSPVIGMMSRSTADGDQATILLQQTNATSGNFTATGDGRGLGLIGFRGVDSAGVAREGGGIRVEQAGAAISGAVRADMIFRTRDIERVRINSDGDFLVGSTTVTQLTSAALTFDVSSGRLVVTANGATTEPLILNRHDSDGTLIEFRQANTVEGTISVSGSTVSYNGFSGSHDSSGIASDTELGTVCSTIDELDTYPETRKDMDGNDEDHPKKGQTRADHPKIKVSDSVGDARVYGVLGGFQKDGKPVVVSVGIGSVRVTGSCNGGDLLESNGDGTAKVQSDDIIRSKTIGKVTIGNSSSSVKLVSCVLYCG